MHLGQLQVGTLCQRMKSTILGLMGAERKPLVDLHFAFLQFKTLALKRSPGTTLLSTLLAFRREARLQQGFDARSSASGLLEDVTPKQLLLITEMCGQTELLVDPCQPP